MEDVQTTVEETAAAESIRAFASTGQVEIAAKTILHRELRSNNIYVSRVLHRGGIYIATFQHLGPANARCGSLGAKLRYNALTGRFDAYCPCHKLTIDAEPRRAVTISQMLSFLSVHRKHVHNVNCEWWRVGGVWYKAKDIFREALLMMGYAPQHAFDAWSMMYNIKSQAFGRKSLPELSNDLRDELELGFKHLVLKDPQMLLKHPNLHLVVIKRDKWDFQQRLGGPFDCTLLGARQQPRPPIRIRDKLVDRKAPAPKQSMMMSTFECVGYLPLSPEDLLRLVSDFTPIMLCPHVDIDASAEDVILWRQRVWLALARGCHVIVPFEDDRTVFRPLRSLLRLQKETIGRDKLYTLLEAT